MKPLNTSWLKQPLKPVKGGRKRKSDCAKALGQWLKKINVKKNANHDFFHGGLTIFLATNNVNFSIIGSMLA